MPHVESERDARIAVIIDEVVAALRAGRPIDVSTWRERYPEFADELPALIDTVRNLDTAVEDMRMISTSSKPLLDATVPVAPARRGPEESTEPLPARIGRYRILEHLGRGGMGTVYKALDPQLDRVVALKVPRFDISERQRAVSVQRFLREARAAAKIRHPHVCPIYDVGEHEGSPYVVMAYVEGQSLDERLHGQRRFEDPAEAVTLARQVAEALEAVHAHGIIHRDLKPGNILIDSAGRAVLTDFGLARPEKDTEHLTVDGAIVGTPAFMAPEQASGDAEQIGPSTDLYSLGVVLYRMLTGRLPFEGQTLALLNKIVHEPAPTPSSVRPGLDRVLDAICLKAMAKRPGDRYQSASQIAAALDQFRRPPQPTVRVPPQSVARISGEPEGVSPRIQPCDPINPGADARRLAGVAGEARATKLPLRWITTAAAVLLAAAGLFFGGQIIRVVTNQGELVIVVDDPTVEIKIVQNGVVVQDQTSKRQFTLTAIKGQVEVLEKDGIKLTTKQFELTRGGKTTVKVTLTELADARQPKASGIATLQPSTGWHGWPADAPPPAIAPFDAATAERHQEAWAKYLQIDVEYTNSLGMKFRLIPPGEFTMGSTPAEIEYALKFTGDEKHWQECIKSEAPQHKVILTQPIYLGVHEVTQADYEKVMGKNPSYLATTGPEKVLAEKVAGMDTTSHPVEGVSWNDAAEFCAKLSQQEKLKPFYFRAGETVTPLDGTGYRLPSEAEWELACRAGTTTKYWIGDKDEELMRAGWFATNSGGRTHAVGELKGNPFGLYDIHGNVWEWVQDRWEPTYYGQFQEMAAINPDGPFSAGSQRVIRGGGWYDDASNCRASNRVASDPTYRCDNIGFRVSLVAVGPRVVR